MGELIWVKDKKRLRSVKMDMEWSSGEEEWRTGLKRRMEKGEKCIMRRKKSVMVEMKEELREKGSKREKM